MTRDQEILWNITKTLGSASAELSRDSLLVLLERVRSYCATRISDIREEQAEETHSKVKL